MNKCQVCNYNLDQMEAACVSTYELGDLCTTCAGFQIDALRDQLRWRKWPEEMPEKSGRYLKLLRDRCEELTRFNLDEYCKVTQKWWGGDPIYWRPIGNLPEGGE